MKANKKGMYSRFVDNGKLSVLTSGRRDDGFLPECKTSIRNKSNFGRVRRRRRKKFALLRSLLFPGGRSDNTLLSCSSLNLPAF